MVVLKRSMYIGHGVLSDIYQLSVFKEYPFKFFLFNTVFVRKLFFKQEKQQNVSILLYTCAYFNAVL